MTPVFTPETNYCIRSSPNTKSVTGRRNVARTKTERNVTALPHRWALWLTVDGDLRFLSHHDMMRNIERLLVRAGLPIRCSQGFNPRPIFSLIPPRPVGISSKEDLLTIELDSQIARDDLLSSLNDHTPEGMSFAKAIELGPRRTIRPIVCKYKLRLSTDQLATVSGAIGHFDSAEEFLIERTRASKRRDRPPQTRQLDLKLLVCDLSVQCDTLCWQQVPQGDIWARPGEILDMLGLDPVKELAGLIRTDVIYEGIEQADN